MLYLALHALGAPYEQMYSATPTIGASTTARVSSMVTMLMLAQPANATLSRDVGGGSGTVKDSRRRSSPTVGDSISSLNSS